MSEDEGPLTARVASAVVEALNREHLMTLACLRADGWPQATTVGFVNEGLDLYFVVSRGSQKLANLQADPRASVAVRISGPGAGDGVGVSMGGRVEEVTDPVEVERLNRAVIDRFPGIHVHCPSGDSVAVLRFRPTVVSAVGVVAGRSSPETFTVDAPANVAGRSDA